MTPKSRNSPKRRRKQNKSRRSIIIVALIAIVIGSLTVGYVLFANPGGHTGNSSRSLVSTFTNESKPIILYVNQGNGIVNRTNFSSLLVFASGQGFNTIFFQIYRSGVSLFSSNDLSYFVEASHSQPLKIFFSLYFTNSSQQLPAAIYNLGEDGINLDMSTLDSTSQSSLLSTLEATYHDGVRAVTTYDFSTALKPDMLIFETYGTQDDQYIRSGIVASVGVFTTTSKQQYEAEFTYALDNSNGVMVFDYAGLQKSGY